MDDWQLQKDRRRDLATRGFIDARRVATDGGMILCRHTEQHYSLRQHDDSGWILHIYPGRRRLYRDKGRPTRTPFLAVPPHWTLYDVVEAAVTATAHGGTA